MSYHYNIVERQKRQRKKKRAMENPAKKTIRNKREKKRKRNVLSLQYCRKAKEKKEKSNGKPHKKQIK